MHIGETDDAPGAAAIGILLGIGAVTLGILKSTITDVAKAFGLVAIGAGIAAVGLYIGGTDDAPGAAAIGILLGIGVATLGLRTARRKA